MKHLSRSLPVLVALAAIPVAVLMAPTVINYVVPQATAALDAQPKDVIRAAGLALPALLLAVPLATVAVRRFPPVFALACGLFAILAGQLAAQYAESVLVFGASRVVQGLGAGVLLPAVLTLAWQSRTRLPLAVFAGTFVGALIVAMPLALSAVPKANGRWREALTPYPWLAGVALAVGALALIFRNQAQALPPLRSTERTQLLLPMVPAAGFAFLAVAAADSSWTSGVKLIVAGLGLVALTGLAIVGSRDATTGSPLGSALVMVTVGLLVLPVTAPLAGLVGTEYDPGDLPLWPFLAGAVAAIAGACVTVRLRTEHARAALGTGFGFTLIAVLVLLMTDPEASLALLTVPVVLLGAGAGMALAASLSEARLGSALFGLTLCFPAVLTGHLIAGALQVKELDDAVRAGGGPADIVFALTSAFRIWLIIAGVLVVVLAGTAMLVARRGTDRLIGDIPHTENRAMENNPWPSAL